MWPFTTNPPPPEPPDYSFLICIAFLWLLCRVYGQNIKRRFRTKLKDLPSLDSVIGLESVKEEMRQYMSLIENDLKYLSWEVQLPRGILLVGPPGTGKTLLVKALAKELDMPIEVAAGSDFVEKYVGVGAARVRALFIRARSHEKCVIFIDEIDAVGAIRDSGNNSERANTLNQLLVEMDGFDSDNRVIVFAATNLAKTLDPALLRSGRFDKKVYFDLPNPNEREQLFELYLGDTETSCEANKLAERTTGLSGADIANIVNQAKLNAMANESTLIDQTEMNEAIDEIMIGREKRERSLTTVELERVAHHEAGHALIACLIKQARKPLKVSIIPRGEFALGFSQDQSSDRRLYHQDDILSKVAVLLGGRAAEKAIYGDVSTGASDDIEKSTTLLSSYVTKWGMSPSYGPINPTHLYCSEDDNSTNEVRSLSNTIEEIVDHTILENKKTLRKIAKKLLKKETIYYKDLKRVIGRENLNKLDMRVFREELILSRLQ